MANKENYYENVIKKFPNEDLLVEFLNKDDIMDKWSDEDREYFIFKYLKDKGWIGVEDLVEDVTPEKPVAAKKTKKKV